MKCPRCDGRGGWVTGPHAEDCKFCDGTGEVEPCACCGKPSIRNYDDREDCPSCGSMRCELSMQMAMDYNDERGG